MTRVIAFSRLGLDLDFIDPFFFSFFLSHLFDLCPSNDPRHLPGLGKKNKNKKGIYVTFSMEVRAIFYFIYLFPGLHLHSA